MSTKTAIWTGMIVGSFIGGYLPVMFGTSLLSLWSLFGNGIGGLIGIYLGYKMTT